MKKLIVVTLLLMTGCAVAPEQRSFMDDVAKGLRRGALAGAGALSPDVYAAQHGLPPPQRTNLITNCRPDYTGGMECTTESR